MKEFQQARLVRMAQDLGLPVAEVAALFVPAGEMQAITPTPIVPQGHETPSLPATEMSWVGKALDWKIRHLAESQASWEVLSTYVWQLYYGQPGPNAAARVGELAFLYGSSLDLFDAFKTLVGLEEHFYEKIRPAIRTLIVLKLWIEGWDAVVQPLFIGKDFEKTPVEKLIEFRVLSRHTDPEPAWLLLQHNQNDLIYAVEEFAEQLHWHLHDFLLAAGSLAVRVGQGDVAQELLEKIPLDSPVHPEAQNWILAIKPLRDQQGFTSFEKRLNLEPDWRGRVRLLVQWLAELQREEPEAVKNRPALVGVFEDFWRWFPAQPDIYRAVSDALIEYRAVLKQFPQYELPILKMSLQFQPSQLEVALWQPFLHMDAGFAPSFLLWQAAAKVHLFATGIQEYEQLIWEAYDTYRDLEHDESLRVNWDSLRREALGWVQRTPTFAEEKRQFLLDYLNLLGEPQHLTTHDVMQCLRHNRTLHHQTIDRLIQVVRRADDIALELQLLQLKAGSSHATNQDLNRMWHISSRLNKHDFCWRIATVIQNRKISVASVYHAWLISGENRNDYAIYPVKRESLAILTQHLNEEAQRFLEHMLVIGPKLPELFAVVVPGSRVTKREVGKNTRDTAIEATLASMEWLGDQKKMYWIPFAASTHDFALPDFVQVLPANPWSLLMVRLAQALGITAWGWNIQNVRQYLIGLLPRGSQPADVRIAKWLKTLTSTERHSWQEFVLMTGKLSEKQVEEWVFSFLTRMALVMYQNNNQALADLQTMRAPVQFVWQLEHWILSEEYSQIRRRLQSQNKVPVPLALQQLTKVVQQL